MFFDINNVYYYLQYLFLSFNAYVNPKLQKKEKNPVCLEIIFTFFS